MKRPTTLAALALVCAGCSVVYDPSAHMMGMDGGRTDDGGMDGGRTDGGGTDGGRTDGGRTDGGGTDGGGDSGTDAGPPTIALEDFCSTVAEVYCANAETCCELMTTFDRARCLSQVENDCASVYGLASTRGEIDYDEVAAYATLARGTELVEACSVGVQDFMVQRNGLLGGIVGTVGGGMDCTPASRSETDVIVAVLSCRDGQVCREISATRWTCQVPAPDGEPCRYAFDCEHGRCEQEARFLAPRLCGSGEPGGSPCNPFQPDECASLACAWDATARGFQCAAATVNNVYCTYASPAPDG